MTSITPTLSCAVRQLKCLICGKHVTFEISCSTSVIDESQVHTPQASLKRSCLWTSHNATCCDRYFTPVYDAEPATYITPLKFGLYSSLAATIQQFLLQFWQPRLQVVSLNTREDCMQTAIEQVDLPLFVCWLSLPLRITTERFQIPHTKKRNLAKPKNGVWKLNKENLRNGTVYSLLHFECLSIWIRNLDLEFGPFWKGPGAKQT